MTGNPPEDDIDPEFEADIAAGLADLEAGRVVPWPAVREWMESWGTEKELPPPTVG